MPRTSHSYTANGVVPCNRPGNFQGLIIMSPHQVGHICREIIGINPIQGKNSPQTHSRYGFDWADLVITVGCDAVECAPQYWNPDGDIPILHIDSSSAKLSHYYRPNLELIGNLSNLLANLSKLANRDGKEDSYFLELCALNSDKS